VSTTDASGPSSSVAEIEKTFRHEFGRAVATLVRLFGDIDLAEEAVQEAFVVALDRWPTSGVPPNPGGWIVTTSRNRAIDRLRREASRDDRHAQAAMVHDPDTPPEEMGPLPDDRLRLIFTCCHPSLGPGAQVALTLRLLGGLETGEIARAFLVPETTMAQRLVRAKRKIRAAAKPTGSPPTPSCPTASARCWPSSTWSSTRATRPPPATPWFGVTCALRPSAWPGCWPT